MGFLKVTKMDKEKEAKKLHWIEKLLEARILAIERRAHDKRFEFMVQLFTFFNDSEPDKAKKDKERLIEKIDKFYESIEQGELKWDSLETIRKLWKFEMEIFSYLNKYFNFSATTKGFNVIEEEEEDE